MRALLIGAALGALCLGGHASAQAMQIGATVASDGTCPSTAVLNPGIGRNIYADSSGAMCFDANVTASFASVGTIGDAAPASANYLGYSDGINLQGVTATTPLPVALEGYSYAHIATDTSTTVKSGAGFLHSITINTGGVSSVITIYDNTAASGTVIGIITLPATPGAPVTLTFDVAFSTGLEIKTGTAAPDLTVSYK